jgi:GTP-binding protein EngB required for normal cell division
MPAPSTEYDTLDQLQTPEQVALLDAIDELRGKRLGLHGIDLPQLIVCGEQSTGKSSLLEGLTRLRFPMKGTLCTTFATEVVLRRASKTTISCTITPSEGRSQIHCRELLKFERKFSSREEFSFPSVIEEAKILMTKESKTGPETLLKDVLRVRYSGPDLPSLTIVDLPGMIEEDLNDVDGAERIVDLVTGYMKNEKSIILAVVMAGNDPENQKPMKYLRQYDPTRSRTLGIITKPDKVDRGSDSETDLLRLARNEKYPLKHGWYAVRNRDFATKNHSDAERDDLERQFFNSGRWASHPRDLVGITALRLKLSKMLLDHITMELPSLVASIQDAAKVIESRLKALGDTRETAKEQRTYLTRHSEKFQMLTNDALRGIYSNRFFELSAPDKQAATRLRTAIQNLNIAFASTMYRKGHTWDISEIKGNRSIFLGDSYPVIEQYGSCFEDPVFINRGDFLESHIGQYVRQSRPSGLPSLVNPWVCLIMT